MSPPPAEHLGYLRVLHRLRERGVVFAVIGSFGLRLHMEELDGETVPDCDLLLDPAPDNLQRWAATLAEEGWTLTVWEQPVSPPLDLALLRGKYYVRAKKDTLVLDGTYELDTLPLRELLSRVSFLQEIPVAELDTILALKRGRGAPRDLEVIARVERWRQQSSRTEPTRPT